MTQSVRHYETLASICDMSKPTQFPLALDPNKFNSLGVACAVLPRKTNVIGSLLFLNLDMDLCALYSLSDAAKCCMRVLGKQNCLLNTRQLSRLHADNQEHPTFAVIVRILA
eukprot:gnl/MRDRNA2_/MRDRNA2_297061_c0_seq1.p1 gnl/MRDRNA2_/MRDRNA2_297061_c0~~gnl/MRDRNA2_/MRDRNA2_297061_c0_seq1.p1  ORF type:complete len:112 (-),score=6.91 gnl/MRDRNA2_/MRDRNA2_297061_c0_seq1:251-586(-)